MPERPSEPDAPPPPHRAAPDAASARRDRSARPPCPRCGAPLGTLAADVATADRTLDSPPDGTPDAFYCGCCGLVLPAA